MFPSSFAIYPIEFCKIRHLVTLGIWQNTKIFRVGFMITRLTILTPYFLEKLWSKSSLNLASLSSSVDDPTGVGFAAWTELMFGSRLVFGRRTPEFGGVDK
jgi:hypothetical protein